MTEDSAAFLVLKKGIFSGQGCGLSNFDSFIIFTLDMIDEIIDTPPSRY